MDGKIGAIQTAHVLQLQLSRLQLNIGHKWIEVCAIKGGQQVASDFLERELGRRSHSPSICDVVDATNPRCAKHANSLDTCALLL